MIRVPDEFSPEQRLRVLSGVIRRGRESPRVLAYFGEVMRHGDSAWVRAESVLRRCQLVPYTPDPPGVDVYYELAEVLDGAPADCEELASLVVCGASLSCLRSGLFWLFQHRSRQDHLTARIVVNGRLEWAEATVAARLGEHPIAAVRRLRRPEVLHGRVVT